MDALPAILDFDGPMGLLLAVPFALVALAAIPYTIWARRKRRLARRAEMGEPGGEPSLVEDPARPAEASDDPYLWLRLVVAFAICAGLAWLCYRILPRAGVDVPWWVPVLAFAIILVATAVRRAGEPRPPDDADSNAEAG